MLDYLRLFLLCKGPRPHLRSSAEINSSRPPPRVLFDDLTCVLVIAEHRINRIDELLPWNLAEDSRHAA
jgi:hypothetical protein